MSALGRFFETLDDPGDTPASPPVESQVLSNYPFTGKDPGSRKPSAAALALHKAEHGMCWLCGTYVDEWAATVDHVIPRSVAVTVREFNRRVPARLRLRLAHRGCNHRRGTSEPKRPEAREFYLTVLARFEEMRAAEIANRGASA